jgi:cytoskeletal protein CcmA (bactofilin family)
MFGRSSTRLETVIGSDSTIRGELTIQGTVKVEGNIDASEIVELKDKAQVFGEICAAKLAMSEGALFDGQSSMKQKKETSGGQEKRVTPLTASRTAS